MRDRLDLKTTAVPSLSRPASDPRRRRPLSQAGILLLLLGWTLAGVGIWVFAGPVDAWADLDAWQLVLLGFIWGLLPVAAIAFFGTARERELTTSRLDGQLAQANLEMLRMQLHPHFLFNTLNAISSLVHRDADAADRMITRLSDFLRMSLEKDDRHQVSLATELEFLDRYLSIEKVRFRDRLKVEVEVEESCLGAQVPRLILQPLVENAVRHGVAMRSAAGRLAIRGRQEGGRLHLVIADDGPGLPPEGRLRISVGLGNTRARLEQTYAGDYTFELVNTAPAGLEARISIPFETGGTA